LIQIPCIALVRFDRYDHRGEHFATDLRWMFVDEEPEVDRCYDADELIVCGYQIGNGIGGYPGMPCWATLDDVMSTMGTSCWIHARGAKR
jgi:hypothetical protein